MLKQLFYAVIFLFSVFISAQDYLDFARLNFGTGSFDDVDGNNESDVTNFNFEILKPTSLKKGKLLITGLTIENTSIDADTGLDDNLTMTRINLGMKIPHGENWTGTYMLLPKLATNFDGLDNAFQFGALALLEHQKSANWATRFGLYSSSEEFGAVITPLVGFFYRSENSKFHIDAVLPIRAEINYALSDKFSLGSDLRTSVKSYALGDDNAYVQEESIRAAAYASYGILQNNILLRAKVGFDTTDFAVYAEGDDVGAQVLTFPLGDDDRTRLNTEFDSSIFLGFDVIYRIPFN